MIDDLGEALMIDYAEVKARIPIKKADWTRERGRGKKYIYKKITFLHKRFRPPPLFFLFGK